MTLDDSLRRPSCRRARATRRRSGEPGGKEDGPGRHPSRVRGTHAHRQRRVASTVAADRQVSSVPASSNRSMPETRPRARSQHHLGVEDWRVAGAATAGDQDERRSAVRWRNAVMLAGSPVAQGHDAFRPSSVGYGRRWLPALRRLAERSLGGDGLSTGLGGRLVGLWHFRSERGRGDPGTPWQVTSADRESSAELVMWRHILGSADA